jgi:asparagine synthase (glutamine-hydrolysing)
MSAIAGIFYLDNRLLDYANLECMVDILAHRGPDGSDIWHQENIGFGHRMLWNTPESLLEKLPLINSTGELVITSDARIDNREELISMLHLDNCPNEKITDSQLILAAYEKWGESCPEHLLGDFAFAIWDSRNQTLFCARDHFGVKPFYYYCSEQIFVFATEIKAILCLPEVPSQLNEIRVGDFLTSMFDDTTITFYKNILRVPPAHTLTVSSTGTNLRSYWSLDPTREIRLGSDDEYAEAFREIFTEAVRCRLRSALPVGSFLSGGLDSSSIACVAEKLLSENGFAPLPTFSAVFDKVTECDERPFQNAVISQGNFEPHHFYADRVGPLKNIDRVLWHQDEPFFAGNLFLTCGLYDIANQRGVRVILDGFDGDSTVSHGVGYLRELALTGRWFTLINETWGEAKNFYHSFLTLLWPYIWRYSPVLKPGRRIWQALLRRILRRHHLNKQPVWSVGLNPEFIKQIALNKRLEEMQKAVPAHQSEREKHYQILTWGLMPYALEMIDRAAAAFAIEPRFPFWDKRLVEFCLALPPEQKLHHGWSRLVMRRAMNNILPEKVQWRVGKTMMSPNFRHGLVSFNRDILDETIINNSVLIEKYVDINDLKKNYSQFLLEENDKDVTLWVKTVLIIWLKYAYFGLKGGGVL